MTNSSSSSWTPAPDISQQQPLPSGRTTNTWAIWVMALLPLLSIVITLAEDPGAEVRRLIARSVQQVDDAQSGIVTTTVPFDRYTLVSWLVALVLTAVQVALAIIDQRILRRRGVIRPFPWGWVFLNPTYVIGRHVVVRRRVHGSLVPLWVWIVAEVIAIAVSSTILVIAVTGAIASVHLS